jgi:signal transduction histidine kinase
VVVVGAVAGIGGRPEQPVVAVAVADLAAAAGAVAVVATVMLRRATVLLRLAGVRAALTRGTHVGAAALLADAFRDPRIRVGYPTDDGALVDRHGTPLPPVAPRRHRTALVDGQDVVAVLDLADGVPEHLVRAHAGPAMLTAMHNEGLERRLAHQVEILGESRRLLVDHLDAERSRLERDLHDGAQQELLDLAMEWRTLHAAAVATGEPGAAALAAHAERTASVLLGRVRDVAHGIHPAVLDGAGLEPALRHLADTAAEPILLHLRDCGPVPEPVARTAYAVAREAAHGGVDEMAVWREAGDLVLDVRTAAPLGAGVADRVAAAGGRSASSRDGWEVRLPCG